MRKTVVTEFVTLDGIMEDPGGSEKTKDGGWAFKFGREPEGDQFKMDEMLKSRLFIDRSDMHTLHLVDAKPIGESVLILIYHPKDNQ